LKTLVRSVVFVLLTSCVTSQGAPPPPEVLGTFDLVRLGSEPVPNARINRFWFEFSSQGTWELFQEPLGSGTTRGRFSVGELVGGCYQVEMWLYSAPAERSPMEFCGNEMRWYAYHNLGLVSLNLSEPMLFRKRR
jgi:hypothetical protein